MGSLSPAEPLRQALTVAEGVHNGADLGNSTF
jgi:hypothetical protein